MASFRKTLWLMACASALLLFWYLTVIYAQNTKATRQADQAPEASVQETEGEQEKGSRAEETMIRVLITDKDDGSYDHESLYFCSEGGCVITAPGGKIQVGGGEIYTPDSDSLTVGQEITVEACSEGEKIRLSDGSGAVLAEYEGSIRVRKTENGFLCVNIISLERYLCYVLPAEMPASYPEEALKAQAVSARTFVLFQKDCGKYGEYGADVTDDTSCQVYNTQGTDRRCDQAVAETAGQIMTYDGEPAQCYFFSTSCGVTAGAEIWNLSLPYLTGGTVYPQEGGNAGEFEKESENAGEFEKESENAGELEKESENAGELGKLLADEEYFRAYIDENSQGVEKEEAWYRWSVSMSLEEISQRLTEDIGAITSVEVTQRETWGIAREVTIYGTKGTKVLEGQYSIREFFHTGQNTVRRNDGSEVSEDIFLPSGFFYIDVTDGEAAFYGGGFGHGCGMSQNGAKAYAQMGYSYLEILELFYREAEITVVS